MDQKSYKFFSHTNNVAGYTVILEIGQYSTKIGFGGENDPRYTFLSMTGVPKYQNIEMGISQKNIFVGNELIDAMGLYKISYPIENGQISDWTMYKAIVDYCFYLLSVDPTIINVLLLIHPLTYQNDIKNLFKLFIEDIQVMGFYPVVDVMLTMYSGGFTTGLVVDMGAGSTRIAPIYESYALNHAFHVYNLGGTQLDKYLMSLLTEAGLRIDSSVQKEVVKVLKERACFCSLNYEEDMKHLKELTKKYNVPDGSSTELKSQRILVPELYFKPNLNNLELNSLPEVICDVVDQCDIDIRRDLLSKIFLVGGSSLFPQIDDRLQNEIELELSKRGKQLQDVKVIAPMERINSNWVGGSILSMIPEFQDRFVSRAQYYKEGVPSEFLELQ